MGYADLSLSFEYGKPLFRAQLDQLGDNDAFLKDAGWQDSTKAVFYQAAAPTGWTKVVTQNDKMLRVVSGAGGGSGGTLATSTGLTLAHTAHSVTSAPNHTHALGNHTHLFSLASRAGVATGNGNIIWNDGGVLRSTANSGAASVTPLNDGFSATTLVSGSDGGHNHGGSTTGAALANTVLAYVDTIVCSKDTSSGYTDETEEFDHNEKLDFDPFPILAVNDLFNKDRLTPAASVSLFGQVAAPTGWTKLTTQNDKALRIVSGTGGGSGGAQALGTAITLAHNHTLTDDAGHTHTRGAHSHAMLFQGVANGPASPGADNYVVADGSGFLLRSGASGPTTSQQTYESATASDGSGTTDSNGTHNHTVGSSLTDLALAYLDVIQCSKDSGGEPFAYADLSAVASLKKLASKQRLRKFAQNDEYVKFHTPAAATKMFFFQAAAPLTWTKLATQNDKALRIVSGVTGGSAGGTQGLGTQITLAHTHSISSLSHSHAVGSHSHTIASTARSANPILALNGHGRQTVGGQTWVCLYTNTSSSNQVKNATDSSPVGSSDSVSHDHGGATGSLLTNTTLAYVDVIYCSKD